MAPRSVPRTMVYVSQLHARSRPYHRAWAEATEYPEEKPVDTNKTGDMHVATQIVLHVSGRTTDVSRTVPIYESYTLHHAIPASAPSITNGAPPVTTRHRQLFPMRFLLLLLPAVTYMAKPRRLIRHLLSTCGAAPAMTYSAPPAVTYEAPPVAPMVESAPAVTHGAAPAVIFGASAVTHFPPPPVAPVVTYMRGARTIP